MAVSQKILGQAAIASTDGLATVYTVPLSTTATTSTIAICNQDSAAITFSVAVAVAGAGNATKQYICYQQELDAKSTYFLTIGMTLSAEDEVRVTTTGSITSINLFGIEV